MTLKSGFQFAEAWLLVEMAQRAYAGTPSLTEAVATCGVPSCNRSRLKLGRSAAILTPTTRVPRYWIITGRSGRTRG